jgi:hypothetical protein
VNLRQARKIEANRTRLRYKGCTVAKAVALATRHERWLASSGPSMEIRGIWRTTNADYALAVDTE